MTFEEFLALRLDWMVRFATVLCGDRTLAEDVVQEVLIRAYTRWDQISRADSPPAYVRTMIVNEYLTWRRKWARIVPTDYIEAGHEIADHADAHADRALLAHLLTTLPRQQRAVVVLRFYSGLSDAEIAQTLRCSPGTVRGYMSRALASLRVKLIPESVLNLREH